MNQIVLLVGIWGVTLAIPIFSAYAYYQARHWDEWDVMLDESRRDDWFD